MQKGRRARGGAEHSRPERVVAWQKAETSKVGWLNEPEPADSNLEASAGSGLVGSGWVLVGAGSGLVRVWLASGASTSSEARERCLESKVLKGGSWRGKGMVAAFRVGR